MTAVLSPTATTVGMGRYRGGNRRTCTARTGWVQPGTAPDNDITAIQTNTSSLHPEWQTETHRPERCPP